MKLKIKKLHEDAHVPTRAHTSDAGMDLYAYGNFVIPPQGITKIGTGIALGIPNGYVGLIWDKSSMGAKSLKIFGGVVDAGYRGEIIVMIYNFTDDVYRISHGDKIAQMIIQNVELPDIEVVENLEESSRGENGFGSTGK